ncbi:MAG: signal peptidase II [Candidatus Woesearchaeota archaeon]
MISKKKGNVTGKNSNFPFLFLFSTLALLLFDIITKYLVRSNNVSTDGLIAITPVTNKGSLFSLFSEVQSINAVFIIISVLAAILLFFIGVYDKQLRTKQGSLLGLGLILGGVLGNLHDRIFHGAVFDWINLHFWPVFNIADSGIVIGVILSFIALLPKQKKKTSVQKKQGNQN